MIRRFWIILIVAVLLAACNLRMSQALPGSTAETLTPTLAALGMTELKYRILDQFPDFFFCDPDFYPVAREDEAVLALQRFPEIQANTEEFDTILSHNNLSGSEPLTDDQKLLVYRAHKKLAAIPLTMVDGGYPFQIQVAKTEGNGEIISGVIDPIGSISIQEKTPSFAACPICLAAGTLIDTPQGAIPVHQLREGAIVWTMDATGTRVAAPVLRWSSTTAPANHQMVHIRLTDTRALWASPGHPTADGRVLGDLKVGEVLDGALIHAADRILYQGSATYDLLPAGPTGFYWANGILIASTLQKTR